jgi:hypothetical protein
LAAPVPLHPPSSFEPSDAWPSDAGLPRAKLFFLGGESGCHAVRKGSFQEGRQALSFSPISPSLTSPQKALCPLGLCIFLNFASSRRQKKKRSKNGAVRRRRHKPPAASPAPGHRSRPEARADATSPPRRAQYLYSVPIAPQCAHYAAAHTRHQRKHSTHLENPPFGRDPIIP